MIRFNPVKADHDVTDLYRNGMSYVRMVYTYVHSLIFRRIMAV